MEHVIVIVQPDHLNLEMGSKEGRCGQGRIYCKLGPVQKKCGGLGPLIQ